QPVELPARERLELDYGEANVERLIFALVPLVDRLLVELARRGRALVELQLQLTLDGAPERYERIRTAEPTLAGGLVMELVGLRPQPLAFQPARGVDGWPAGGAAGPVEHLFGPYRLAGGWWRTGIRRDYYYAETRRGDWLWVYFDRERRAWFAQGGIA